jgi:phosphatidate cytidylyltransferase
VSKNLALRLAVAAIGIPALIYISYSGGYFLLAFCVLLSGLGGLELALMLRKKGYNVSRVLSVILPVLCVVAAHFEYPVLNILVLAFFVISLFVIKSRSVEIFFDNLFSLLLSVFYLGLLSIFIIYLGALPSNGGKLVVFVFLVVWATDTAAYFGGRVFGRERLAPQLSPNKTLEGFYSGFFGAILAGVFSQLVFLKIGWFKILFMSILACFFGQVGDLLESGIKRHCQVKDSSAIIPGHGGVLDRFDSFLFAVPVVYFIAIYF